MYSFYFLYFLEIIIYDALTSCVNLSQAAGEVLDLGCGDALMARASADISNSSERIPFLSWHVLKFWD